MAAFKVEYSFDSLAELQEFVASKETKAAKVTEKTAEKTPEKTATENKAAKTTKGPKPEAVKEEEEKVPSFIGKKEPAVTYDMIVKAVAEAGLKGLRPQVIEIFQSFGVPTGKQLTEDQWAPCLKKLNELIESHAELA